MAVENLRQLFLERGPGECAIDEVRAIKRSDELDRVVQAELGGDVLPDAGGRCRRVRMKTDPRQKLPQPAELPVLRPEIVAPLADAMGFVHGDEANPAGCEDIQETFAAVAHEPLGGDVQQTIPALAQSGDDLGLLVRRERAVVQGRRHAVANQRVDLILHQRNQRRDHEREARLHDGRRLKTQ